MNEWIYVDEVIKIYKSHTIWHNVNIMRILWGLHQRVDVCRRERVRGSKITLG